MLHLIMLTRFGRVYHRTRAWLGGYSWMPCPSCGENFGGQEWRDVDGHLFVIPSDRDPLGGVGICPGCTAVGVGCRALAEVGQYHWGCEFVALPGDQDQLDRIAEYYRERHRLGEDEQLVVTMPPEHRFRGGKA